MKLKIDYKIMRDFICFLENNTYYNLKTKGQKYTLTNRCNDFLLLEELCKKYK